MPSCMALPTVTTVASGRPVRLAAAMTSSAMRARLADEGDGAARVGARRQVAQEARGEAAARRQVDDAGAIGSGDGEVVRGGDRAQFGVARAALGAGLGEAAGQDEEVAVAARRRLAHRRVDEVGTDDDDDEIGRRGRARARLRRTVRPKISPPLGLTGMTSPP